MRISKSLITLAVLSLSVIAFAQPANPPQGGQQGQRRQAAPTVTTNPNAHDPVLAKEGDWYYLFTTGGGVIKSKDLVTWENDGNVFGPGEFPAWPREHGLGSGYWAPDIIFHNGEWHLTYAVSAFAKNTSVIGHATNKTLDRNSPDYKWVDKGMLVESVPFRDMWNAIDPNVVIDENGDPWLDFGSFWNGMKLVKLTKDMNALAEPQEWRTVCARERAFFLEDNDPGDGAVEAPFIFKKNGWYYLLVSYDYCCRSLNSDYKIVVGRSRDVKGPYLDKEGKSLTRGGGTVIASSSDDYVAIGHCGAYTIDGEDILVAHAYTIADNGASKLFVGNLVWDNDGWFTIEKRNK